MNIYETSYFNKIDKEESISNVAPGSKKKRKSLENKIVTNISPIVTKNIKQKQQSLKRCIERFIHSRSAQIYDYAPIDRIYFRKTEVDDFFKSIDVKEKDIADQMDGLFYINDDELAACKDPFTIAMMTIIRYYILQVKVKPKETPKDILLLCNYLAFSGKFYASVHYKWFRKFIPDRKVMDYVINYMLSQKFDLVRTGSVWGAISCMTNTWILKYWDAFKDSTDEDLVYIIHQLYTRLFAFFRNIAKLYYEAYEKKLYLNTESDNYSDEGNYRITQNNAVLATKITDKTIDYFTSTTVNVSRCHAAASSGVDALELKAIFENIINSNDTIIELRNVINILIVDFMRAYPEIKNVATSIEFIDHTIKMKPNTKDKDIIYMKNTILKWLNTSDRYRNTKTQATRNNYFKGILSYIALTVNAANK